MESLSESVNEYLRLARIADPASAQRIEEAIRGHRQRAAAADFAAQDLTAALTRAAIDLWRDHSADEHLRAAIETHPVEGLTASERLSNAQGILVRELGGEHSSTEPAESRLFISYLEAGDGE